MKLENIEVLYFLGIGGIGMSALARYFHSQGFRVLGYDKTETHLTKALVNEGISVSYNDTGNEVVNHFSSKERTLIVYTPAIPKEHEEYQFLISQNYTLIKRAELLGIISKNSPCLAVAGTHGKTTTSTLLAHVLNCNNIPCTAFLGGISTNFQSNLLLHSDPKWIIVEADEFDRSFLHLSPYASIITSTDADHLDIYDNHEELKQAFNDYSKKVVQEGILVVENSVDVQGIAKIIRYGIAEHDDNQYKILNHYFENETFSFDVETPLGRWKNIELGIPGFHNAENATAVIALGVNIGLTEQQIRKGLASFEGVKRRFEYHIKSDELIFIDDYAHHPSAIKQLISSVRMLYPNRKITGVFQPHLFSRTKDFMDDFALELSQLDKVMLLPIYPAREKPIEGVSSEVLIEKINHSNKELVDQLSLLERLSVSENEVILTIGAGDIDQCIEPIKNLLS